MPSDRVLIVEDDPVLAQGIQGLVEKEGYQVVGLVSSGVEAVSLAVEALPNVILMDIRLDGDMDGIQAAEMIHTQVDIPIIYMTAHAGEETLRRSKATTPFAYLFKPFDGKQLNTTIEMTLYRHKAEKRIRESEGWLETILNSIEDGVIAVDCQGSITNINPVAEAITGWKHDQAVRKPLSDVFMIVEEDTFTPVDLAKFLAHDLENQPVLDRQYMLIDKGRKQIPIEAAPTPILSQRGQMQGLVIAFRDITERRRIEGVIRQQASRSAALVRVASRLNAQLDLDRVLGMVCEEAARALDTPVAGVILYDKDREVFDLAATFGQNNAYEKYRGLFEPIPRNLYENFLAQGNEPIAVVPDLQALSAFPFLDLFRGGDFRSMAIAVMYQDEEIIGTLNAVSIGEVHDFSPDEQFFLKGLADQAVIAILNARLFEQVSSGRERMKMLSKKLVEIQEIERRYLARELHDQVGQVLTGLQLSLEAGKRLSGEALVASLQESQSLVLTLMGQIRELSLRLRPTMLDDMGLLPTLLWHFDKYGNQTGVPVNFNHSGMDRRFSPEMETAVYRIIQEALTNVARYSKADQIKVECLVQGGFLKIMIQDNGRGFDLLQVLRDGKTFGLMGMRERANLLGGRLEIVSSPGNGTQVLAIFPLDRPLERRQYERDRFAGG